MLKPMAQATRVRTRKVPQQILRRQPDALGKLVQSQFDPYQFVDEIPYARGILPRICERLGKLVLQRILTKEVTSQPQCCRVKDHAVKPRPQAQAAKER